MCFYRYFWLICQKICALSFAMVFDFYISDDVGYYYNYNGDKWPKMQ